MSNTITTTSVRRAAIQLISPVESITVAHLKDTIHAATIGVNYHY
ncbi:hypothetical protein ACVWYH_009255 [Bradyrhizobium sp. GM24.11]